MTQAAAAMPQVNIQLETPKDSQAERDRSIRWIVFGLSILLTVSLPYAVVGYVGAVLNHPTAGGLIGFGIGVWFLGLLMPRMIIDNPEWSAYVTQNPFFGGSMVPYGPGIHLALPWEERNADGNYSLEVISRPFTLTIPTTTSKVTIDGRLFYNASLKYVVNAIGVDKEVVEEGLVAFIDCYLSARVGGLSAEEAKKQTVDINNELNEKFRDTPAVTSANAATPEEFEQKFGYSTAAIVLDRIEFPQGVQEALDAVSKTRKLNEIVREALGGITAEQLQEMLRDKTITVEQIKQLTDRARVDAGIVPMRLNVVEGNMGNAVGNFLTEGKGGRS